MIHIRHAWSWIAAREHALVTFARRHTTIRTAFWGVVLTFVAVLAALVWAIHGNRVNATRANANTAEGAEAHSALCVFKADLEHRADVSHAFIADPPSTILGITVTPEVIAQVKSDLANREATIRSLAQLDCGSTAAAPP